AEELAKGLVVDPEEETVLDRVKVRHGGHATPPLGQVAAPVIRHGRRDVEAAPAEVAQPPGQIGILAVEEEVRIEVARRDLRALEGRTPIEPGGARGAEDRLLPLEASGRGLSPAAVEVAARRSGHDSG